MGERKGESKRHPEQEQQRHRNRKTKKETDRGDPERQT